MTHLSPEDGSFKRHLLSFIKNLEDGIRGIRFQTSTDGISHGALVSHSTYSPWIDDKQFQSIWSVVSQFSLLDIYRMYQLWTTTHQLSKNPAMGGDILEVGSWRGGSGCLIAAQAASLIPSAIVYMADTFRGVAKAGQHDTLYRGGEHSDTSPDTVLALANSLTLKNVRLLEGMFPENTGKSIESKQFRMCHIDVDTYQSAKDTFFWVWPKITVGGAVIFDDYGFWGCEGVTKFVNEVAKSGDSFFIHNLTGQAILLKQS